MIVNGKEVEFKPGMTVEDLLRGYHLHACRVYVEVNSKVVTKEHYREVLLSEDDKIQVTAFIGGG
ncbi:sulfur carrier protein ThiS [Clostridium brassicae]|uniref:Sulfur carrier protein ThiS n=1 Tax=Clostridium brassicae TaxID=2999072 RepID=A0ABT4D9J6_9CLOT|nr:sulfur carrier protein ThiS [Clostridium brassicae]MCY6958982.1 sulfur carrier protein ThiS [Clostridium brassicae]